MCISIGGLKCRLAVLRLYNIQYLIDNLGATDLSVLEIKVLTMTPSDPERKRRNW